MKEEALNTSDNYQTRAWMTDKRSTLRHQAVVFVQSGELSNKNPTPSASESEEEESNSTPPGEEQPATVIEETVTVTSIITDEPKSLPSSVPIETLSNDDLFVIDDKPHPVSDNSQPSVSGTSRGPPDPVSADQGTSNPNISSPTAPLPAIDFIPTEETIVFTPRNQRRQRNRVASQQLTNWEVPSTFKAMTDTSAPDWTKPKKKQNRRKGHKQYLHLAGQGEGDVFIEAVGVEMAPIANDALQDYLENIREQGELSEVEEEYINQTLAIEDGTAMGELSLEDKPSGSGKTRHEAHGMASSQPFPSSKLATSLTARDFEKSESVPDLAPDAEIGVSGAEEKAPPVTRNGKSAEEDNWYMEAPQSESESESSEDVSDAFDEQGDLLDEKDDVWNTESDELTTKSKGKEKAVDSQEEDEDEDDKEEELDDDDDDDDDDMDLDDDNEIIANMVVDDFDLDNLDLAMFTLPGLTKKSHTRQPNVPALPSADDDIVSHLQSMWKQDRDSKKQRKLEREQARLLGLLGSKAKTKSKGKKGKRAARKEELERIDELEGGGLAVDMRKINDEIRAFWEDDDATEYDPTFLPFTLHASLYFSLNTV